MSTRESGERPKSHNGMGVDAKGNLVPDPTKNVQALVDAAIERVDDLRILNDRRIDADIKHLKEIVDLDREHTKELRDLEAKRLDAIRQVDVNAVQTEANRSLDAIRALAVTTASNAENLRTALQNTEQVLARQNAEANKLTTDRLAALEKSSYEGAGKQTVTDPQMVELLNAV